MSITITAEAVLKIASAEIGYKEKMSNMLLDNATANAGSGNWTKYARDLASAGYYNGSKNGYAWCDVFVDWCFYQASGKNASVAQQVECQTGPYGAGCLYSAQYYKNAGRWSTSPQVGAQIFFSYQSGEVSHTGLVESFDGTTVTTIEGNTSDMVARRRYNRYDNSIYGYGLPKYGTVSNVSAPSVPSVSVPTITPIANPTSSRKIAPVITIPLKEESYGCVDKTVKAMQILLNAYGYSVGSCGADGDFGRDTEVALKKFQSDHGLASDGECGRDSWGKLLGMS